MGSLSEEEVFALAIQKSPAERAAFLDRTCQDNPSLRAQVESLLAAYDQPDSLLEGGACGATIDVAPSPLPLTEGVGSTIGPYKLLQQIGEGGMGVVYMADQKEPVKRRVALKIIKPGMDTQQVIARFEAERQALAMMDHPNIAKVLDAGATESGRPYFVMELVHGLPVTKYCDEQHLTPKERLELFVPICQAVQHAHQKGIIHRDLKPSNILVAHYDGQPVPKVIDFGVAKATIQTLTEKTMFTQLGQVVGTLEYMSPEQAEQNQLDIDTRSDIYSLGVVLYELLTGDTPFDRTRLRSAAFDEMLRIIREEEPSKPSTKVSGSQSLPSIAANRRIEPARLGSMMRGELDWIVMKAMEKDRARRYETASKFAEDVRHYLNDEAVVACPPSTAYRFKKFASRNRVALSTAMVVVLALLLGVVGTTGQAVRATKAERLAQERYENEREAHREADDARRQMEQQRDRAIAAEELASTEAKRANREAENAKTEAAIAQAVNDFLNDDLLTQANPRSEPDREIKLGTVVDRAADKIEGTGTDQPLVEAAIRNTLGRIYFYLGQYEKAELHFERARALRERELGPEDPSTLADKMNLANAISRQGRLADAEMLYGEVLEVQKRVGGPEHPDTLTSMMNLAAAIMSQDRYPEAEELLLEILPIQKRVLGPEHPDTLGTMANLAVAIKGQGRHPEAEELLLEILPIQKRVLGPEHPGTLMSMMNLAVAIMLQDRHTEAEELLLEILPVQKRVLGPEHPDTLKCMASLADVLNLQGRHAQAEELAREALGIIQRTRDSEHPPALETLTGRLYKFLGDSARKRGDYKRAIEAYRRAIELRDDGGGPHVNLGLALRDSGDTDAAISEFLKAIAYFSAVCQEAQDDDNARKNLAIAENNLGTEFLRQGQYSEAVAHFERAEALGHKNPLSRGDLAHCYLALGNQQKYDEVCQRMISQFPPPEERRTSDWGHLGQALYRAGQYEQAQRSLEKVIELRQDDGPSLERGPLWWYYTMTLCRLGETDRARGYFAQLVEMMKENPPANKELNDRLRAQTAELLEIDVELEEKKEP